MFRFPRSSLSFFVAPALVVACSAAPDEDVGSTESAVCVTNGDARSSFDAYVAGTGGVAGAGLPKTPIFRTTSADGNVYETKCFERRVLEFHPSNACNYRVLGRLLGVARQQQKYPGGFPGAVESGSIDVGAPTGKRLRGDFKRHWDETGGLAENGWPISDYFWEASEAEPGKTYLVQYFERAVFEYHPDNAAPWDVLGKLLGNFNPQCEAARPKPSVNIRMAAFIPGPKPGTSGPSCQRVNFGNIVGGVTGGIFNTDERGFDYERAMTNSKLAIDVDLGADGNVQHVDKHATTTCRYDSDAGEVFPGDGNGWCRRADGSAPVFCKQADSSGIELQDVRSLGTNPDGRVGWHAKVKLNGPIPAVVVAPPIDGWCEVDTFFENGSRDPVDIWAHCEHKAFPSYELYVAGVQVMTHAAFGHSPGDLGSPLPAISTRHHCSKRNDVWTCVNE